MTAVVEFVEIQHQLDVIELKLNSIAGPMQLIAHINLLSKMLFQLKQDSVEWNRVYEERQEKINQLDQLQG